MSDTDLLEVRGELIIVSQPGTQSYAIYTKLVGQPQLVLISSDATQDHELRARIWQAANDRRASWGGSCRGSRRGLLGWQPQRIHERR